jgi:hypothetical protein
MRSGRNRIAYIFHDEMLQVKAGLLASVAAISRWTEFTIDRDLLHAARSIMAYAVVADR